MADREVILSINDYNDLLWLPGLNDPSDPKGLFSPMANPVGRPQAIGLADLLAPPDPPGTRNAAPAGPRNGAQIANEGGHPQEEFSDPLEDLLAPIVSPLDRPITVTRFPTVAANKQHPVVTSLREFAVVIGETRAQNKARLPLLKLATFGDQATAKGALRHDANLSAIDGVEGDYDGGEVSIADAADRLRRAGIAALIHTTPSHTPASPRWRVLCPTSVTLSPDHRMALCERVNGALGDILALESFTRSQAFYFGALEGRDTHHAVTMIEGRPIDQATDVQRVGRQVAVNDDPGPTHADADQNDDDTDEITAADLLGPPDWARIKSALEAIPPAQRDDREGIWRPVGMALHYASGGDAEGFAEWDAWSKAGEKYDAKDLKRVWRSFGERSGGALRIGTLYNLAIRFGWTAKVQPAPVEPSRLTFLTPDQCASSPSRSYIAKGIVSVGDVGCIFGAPGAGKSLIAPHIGYAIAQGRGVWGMRTKPGRVFYVAAEDSHGMRGRVTALKQRHGDAPDFALIEGVSDLLRDDSPDFAALLEAVESQRPAIVFIDTLAMAFPGLEENNAQDMGKVVAVARKLTTWGAAVILIHHDTKAEGSTPRGHSLLNGALDMALHVTRDDVGGIVRAKLTKNRNGSCDRDIAFLIDTEALGTDEDGDEITAALVDELAPGQAPKPEKLTPDQAAIRLLDRMTDRSGLSPEWVDEGLWRAAMSADRSVSASENPDNRRRQIERIVQRLASSGRIEAANDQVRIVRHAEDDGMEEAA